MVLLTAQRIACWIETTGVIKYMAGFANETSYNYVVDVADGVRDYDQNKNSALTQQGAVIRCRYKAWRLSIGKREANSLKETLAN